MKEQNFSQEELHELEALEVRGGFGIEPLSQTECKNIVIGCGGGNSDQTRCLNAVTGCGEDSGLKNFRCGSQIQCALCLNDNEFCFKP